MGSMTSPASASLKEILTRLDQRIQRVDEERWLSSRYAKESDREVLIVLYAFYFELARVRVAVTDATLGQIRFHWWRDALAELEEGNIRQHDVVLAIEAILLRGSICMDDLLPLIDAHESAFQTDNRSQEPEDQLAVLAARALGGQGETDEIEQVALEWAALRRGDTAEADTQKVQLESKIRPALAHLRLRHTWQRGEMPGALSRRICVLIAVLTGSV